MYVNCLSTYSDKKSCHTSTTLQTSIAQSVSDSWASCYSVQKHNCWRVRRQNCHCVMCFFNGIMSNNSSWQLSCMFGPLTSICHIWECDGLEKGKYRENCLCLAVLCNIITVHEQFLQVGRLYRALILLSLALCFPSTSVFFDLHGAMYTLKNFLLTSFSLPFSELSLVRLALDLVD